MGGARGGKVPFPLRSIDDVDGRVDAFFGAGRPHHGADGLGHPAPAADDTAHVVGSDVEPQGDGVTALVGLYDHVEIWAAENATHDTNVLRLSKSISPESVGATQLYDTAYSTHLGISANAITWASLGFGIAIGLMK